MEKVDTAQLREKDVVNLCDGTRLGHVSDVEIDITSGRVIALEISRESGLFGFGRETAAIIPWEYVECIGADTVLVRFVSGSDGQDKDIAKRRRRGE